VAELTDNLASTRARVDTALEDAKSLKNIAERQSNLIKTNP